MNRVIAVDLASRKTHTGVGAVDVLLPLSGKAGIESRSGGEGGNFQLVFTFAHPLSAVGTAGLSTGTITGATIGSDPHQVIVDVSGVTDAQTIAVTLGSVADSTGAFSDALVVSMSALTGDVNADGVVNSGDATVVRNLSGQQVTTADARTIRADLNLDGTLNSGDAIVVRNRSGNSANRGD
jgi:hypothetical protein